jgi:hypothetical protein
MTGRFAAALAALLLLGAAAHADPVRIMAAFTFNDFGYGHPAGN